MSTAQLTRESLETRDISADRSTMAQRMETYRDLAPTKHQPLIIPENSDTTCPIDSSVPEVAASDLTTERLRTAIAEHGALIVRDMFSQAETTTWVEVIDRVLDASSAPKAARSTLASPYFYPPDNMASIMPQKAQELGNLRLFNNASGAVMAVEAPSVAEALLGFYQKYGIKKLIQDYLGEPACLSVKKWVLRRSKLPFSAAGWHQDGAFMGTDINSINMWIPLTHCGGETGAPGMDVVPRRLHKIASAEGATFNWSVSDEFVRGGAFNVQPVAPVFNAGDVFFFDHFYLHRTQTRDDFSRVRYAIETWFFGSTTFPKDQVPLAW